MNKKRLSIIASAALLGLLAIGCAGCASFTPDKAKADIKAVASIGGRKALQLDPNARPYLQSVEVVIEAALNDGSFEPASLNDALAGISVKELRDPTVSDIIKDVFSVYEANLGDLVARGLDKNKYARPILEGLRDGLKQALGP